MAREAREQTSSLFSIQQISDMSVFRDDADRYQFMDILSRAKEKFNFDLYTYCILNDRSFWLIIDVKQRSISTVLQSILITYASYRESEEKLFLDRFISKPLLSVEDLRREIDYLDQQKEKLGDEFCRYDKRHNQPIEIDMRQVQVVVNEGPQKLAVTDILRVVSERLPNHSLSEIQSNKSQRNQLIRDLYREYYVTLKALGHVFDLSESSVSKIVR